MTYDKISRDMNPPVEGAYLTDRGWEVKNADGTTELLIALKNRESKSITPHTIHFKEIENEKLYWWTNGEINIRDSVCPGRGFKKGMTRKKK